MDNEPAKTISYKRARFATQLPVDALYSPAHFWIARAESDTWQVGLTKFGSRMLGEMVDYGIDTAPGTLVSPGQVIGWIEGFKAVSDLFCIAEGTFAGANPELESHITAINQDPYGAGWIYAVTGKPDGTCVDVQGYARILDATIDKLLQSNEG